MHIDYINGNNSTNGYTYAGSFKGRVHIVPYGNSTQTVQQVGSTHADRLLEVDGKIVSRKMVTTSQNWADDEFKNLISLDDFAQEIAFAAKNLHLPGIPSENEIIENGIDHSEMAAMQMRKIERLYLYMNQMYISLVNLKRVNFVTTVLLVTSVVFILAFSLFLIFQSKKLSLLQGEKKMLVEELREIKRKIS